MRVGDAFRTGTSPARGPGALPCSTRSTRPRRATGSGVDRDGRLNRRPAASNLRPAPNSPRRTAVTRVPTWAEHSEATARRCQPAERVEHDVDVTDSFGEVDLRVVRSLSSAPSPSTTLPLASRRRSRSHARQGLFAIWIATVADAAHHRPWTRTVVARGHAARSTRPCPRRQPDDRQRRSLDVRKATGRLTRQVPRPERTTTSAYALARRGNSGIPNTSSPGLKPPRPAGASSTTPLMSPAEDERRPGRSAGTRRAPQAAPPAGSARSPLTRTRTSVGSGWGSGRVDDGEAPQGNPPSFSWVMTRMTPPSFGGGRNPRLCFR